MHDKRQMFLAPLLHLQCSFLRIGIDCERHCAINHAIEDSIYIRRQVNSILCREALQDFAQNIVFGDYLNDIESSTEALSTMDLRAMFQLEIQDRFSLSCNERGCELV